MVLAFIKVLAAAAAVADLHPVFLADHLGNSINAQANVGGDGGSGGDLETFQSLTAQT